MCGLKASILFVDVKTSVNIIKFNSFMLKKGSFTPMASYPKEKPLTETYILSFICLGRGLLTPLSLATMVRM